MTPVHLSSSALSRLACVVSSLSYNRPANRPRACQDLGKLPVLDVPMTWLVVAKSTFHVTNLSSYNLFFVSLFCCSGDFHMLELNPTDCTR